MRKVIKDKRKAKKAKNKWLWRYAAFKVAQAQEQAAMEILQEGSGECLPGTLGYFLFEVPKARMNLRRVVPTDFTVGPTSVTPDDAEPSIVEYRVLGDGWTHAKK